MFFETEQPKETFKPVTFKITFNEEKELQEFQIRMSLYYQDLVRTRPTAMKKLESMHKLNRGSCIHGICEFRRFLSEILGKFSLEFDCRNK